ncbi:MAG: hypothetical protein ACLQBY_02615 [Solirubrobacteraceae bacterium]
MTDQPKPITREELDYQLNEVLDVMQKAGHEANRLAREERIDRVKVPSRVPSRDESFRALRELIEDHVAVTSPMTDENEIDPWEEHREIAKRALASLKLLQLRTIAESIGVPKSGRRDALLDRIVRRLQANEAEIARLVVMYAEDLPSELRHTTRLYPLEHRVPSAGVFERLSGYARRYIKVGIAQWFIFRRIEQISGGIFVEGTYRSYRVGATAVSDDETTYELESVRRDLAASALIRPGTSFLEMRAGGATESRALARAVELAAGLPRNETLPSGSSPQWDDRQWDAGTLLLLDLLNSSLRSETVHVANLTMAGFETSRATEPPDEESSDRPQVRSVRFHGQHILDSRPACELIVEHERLAHIALQVWFRSEGGERILLPVRVDLESDHATVITGFGMMPRGVSAQLQRLLVRDVEKKLIHGPSDPEGLRRLMGQIEERAKQEEEPERATMFSDEPEEPERATMSAGEAEEPERPTMSAGEADEA